MQVLGVGNYDMMAGGVSNLQERFLSQLRHLD